MTSDSTRQFGECGMFMTRDEFRKAVFSQQDSGGYDPGGYLAGEFKGVAFLARFGHCSCYGTFDGLCGGGIGDYFEEGTPVFDWSGTPADLVEMAKRDADPNMPDRKSNTEDYNYGYLAAVYRDVIEHYGG